MIEENLCQKAVAKDFGEMGLEETPTFERYENNSADDMPDELPK